MKLSSFLIGVFMLLGMVSKAQVTTFGDSKPEDFEFLPYQGSRIIQGFRVDMGNKKYCIVYSKPSKGVTPDTVFIQQYLKTDDKWNVILKGNRSSSNTIFIWGKRGGFFTDDAKNGIAYTAFSEENLSSNERFIVGYFITYNNEVYTIEESKNGEILKSSNYSKLPKTAQERIEEAFSQLDKWN